MILRAFLFACLVALSPTLASAHAAPSDPLVAPVLTPVPPRAPDYSVSIGLHVSAAIAGPLGTGAIALGSIALFGCSFGGGSSCGTWVALTWTGVALLTASVALGISASAVHASTRHAASSVRLVAPSLWADTTGAGGSFGLSF